MIQPTNDGTLYLANLDSERFPEEKILLEQLSQVAQSTPQGIQNITAIWDPQYVSPFPHR